MDNSIIKKIIEDDFDLSHNIRLCIQIIPEELFDDENININNNKEENKNILEISIRYFDFSTWKLTSPITLLINEDITYDILCKIILKHYPYIESNENIQIIKLSGGYNTYLDTMLKFKPNTLIEYLDNKINKYPLFINTEGKMLIIKDKRIPAQEPNEDIKKYGFEPLDNNQNKNINENNSNISNGRVKQMIELFNKGEFDPVNRVHTDINYIKEHKNKNKIKEKGIKIKIKMLEDNNEEKKEENININDNNNNDDNEYRNIESEGIEPLI